MIAGTALATTFDMKEGTVWRYGQRIPCVRPERDLAQILAVGVELVPDVATPDPRMIVWINDDKVHIEKPGVGELTDESASGREDLHAVIDGVSNVEVVAAVERHVARIVQVIDVGSRGSTAPGIEPRSRR